MAAQAGGQVTFLCSAVGVRRSCPEPGRAGRGSDQGRRGAGEAVVEGTATGSARPPQDQPVGLQVQMQAVPMA